MKFRENHQYTYVFVLPDNRIPCWGTFIRDAEAVLRTSLVLLNEFDDFEWRKAFHFLKQEENGPDLTGEIDERHDMKCGLKIFRAEYVSDADNAARAAGGISPFS